VDLSPEKLLLVGVIAMIVLGPERLPHAARTAGRMLAEVRRLSASARNEVTNAMAEPRDALDRAVGDLGLTDVRSTLVGARTSIRGAFDEAVDEATGRERPAGQERAAGQERPAGPERPAGQERAAGSTLTGPPMGATVEPPGATVGLVTPAPAPPSTEVPDDPTLN
jgi:sec-independent protein translocase protein TatB